MWIEIKYSNFFYISTNSIQVFVGIHFKLCLNYSFFLSFLLLNVQLIWSENKLLQMKRCCRKMPRTHAFNSPHYIRNNKHRTRLCECAWSSLCCHTVKDCLFVTLLATVKATVPPVGGNHSMQMHRLNEIQFKTEENTYRSRIIVKWCYFHLLFGIWVFLRTQHPLDARRHLGILTICNNNDARVKWNDWGMSTVEHWGSPSSLSPE